MKYKTIEITPDKSDNDLAKEISLGLTGGKDKIHWYDLIIVWIIVGNLLFYGALLVAAIFLVRYLV